MKDLREPVSGAESCWIVMVVVIILAASMLLSSCQTIGGISRDLESVGRYGRQHIKCDSD